MYIGVGEKHNNLLDIFVDGRCLTCDPEFTIMLNGTVLQGCHAVRQTKHPSICHLEGPADYVTNLVRGEG